MPNRNIVTAIEAALDASLDDEHLIDHIATRVRPEPWTLAEERLRRW
jgi:hypothetical protein